MKPSESKPKILYVDDEPHNITGLRAILRKEYEVIGCMSVKEAYVLLAEQEFQIIVADLKLGEDDGVDFLDDIRLKYPRPVKILLTAFFDFEAAVKGINKAKIFSYLFKPLNEDEVLSTIRIAYEHYQNNTLLEFRKDELEKAHEELNRFVYSASHDMRAPLRSIMGIIKVAEMEGIDERVQHYFSLIERSVNQLDAFNVNLISYFKNSKQETVIEPIDFKEIARDIFEQFQYYPGAESINFIINTNQNTPWMGDLFRIKIIFNNLITNAIKFQRNEIANKHIIFTCDTKGPDKAVLTFEDNGIGIDEENQKRIFEMFYRATRENSGSGIGLYIVKEAINKIGALIRIESKPNMGTKFILEIPSKLNIEA
ncbi:MAG: hybrid sensor histidine kinase/response regulator [Bacteroidota bacterium]|nr:hybrid sensor histidine kinase/response regulator [Bacteroidota bacterium]